MAQIISAEGVFVYSLPKRKNFVCRLLACVVVCFLFACFFPIAVYNALYTSFMFFAMFICTIAGILVCFNASIKDIVFCAIAGYTVQHVYQELYELLDVAFGLGSAININFYGSATVDTVFMVENFVRVIGFFVAYLVAYALLCVGAWLFFGKLVKKYDICKLNSVIMIIIAVAVVVIDIILSSIVTFSEAITSNVTATVMLHIYNIACCVFVMVLLFELPRRRQAELELVVTKSLQEKEKMQYVVAKENIEKLNMRCHDLKHQLRAMTEQTTVDEDFVKELSSAIDDFDSFYKTDNSALNVILNEKNTVCRNKGIELSCILDGGGLGFMRGRYVYSLFGNLLDNAIEAVEKLEETKRAIGLNVRTVGGFLLINIYNSYEGDLNVGGGLPKTSKKHADFHGYGLKSVQSVVNHYDGNMSITTKDGVFDVSIAIPIPPEEMQE